MPASQLIIHPVEDAKVVNFRYNSILDSGVIESMADELYALVDEQAVRKLVLDFSEIKFISSQALGALITLKGKAEAIKGQIAVCGVRPELLRIFKIMNLQKFFKFHGTEQEALASFSVFIA
jgi:anti-anti-sigma factor